MHSKVLIVARPAIYTLGIHNTTHLLYFNLFWSSRLGGILAANLSHIRRYLYLGRTGIADVRIIPTITGLLDQDLGPGK